MQKEVNKSMTTRQAFIYSAEKAGINIQYYLDTKDESFFNRAASYVRAAHSLLKEMNDELE